MKIFQFAILASAVHGDRKVSKKRCEQEIMEENMKYCEDHNTSLSGCVDWIKEGSALTKNVHTRTFVHVAQYLSPYKISNICVMVTSIRVS